MLNFGPVLDEGDRRVVPRGLWHLWVYFGDWTITVGRRTLATCNDKPIDMDRAAMQLTGRRLESFTLVGSETRIEFSGAARLIVLSHEDNGDEPDWMLFYPNDNVVRCGPRGSMVFSKANGIR